MSSCDGPSPFDVERCRRDFPVLDADPPSIYLDSAATSLRCQPVIDALADFYSGNVGSVHRGVHRGGRTVDEHYRMARERVAWAIGADPSEIVFTANCTEAIHLVAFGHPAGRGPVVVTDGNHHSALLPFYGPDPATLRRAALHSDGTLNLADLERRLDGAALLVLPHVNNTLGWLQPVAEAVDLARDAGARVLLDGAQSVPHMPIDVDALGVDFLTWSGHKMLAPFGIGALYGRREELERMRPARLGGGMVDGVSVSGMTLRPVPERFEAGTPNVGGAVALAAAFDYLEELGQGAIHDYVRALTRLARGRLRRIDGLTVHGPQDDEGATCAVTFSAAGIHAHALSRLLSDRFGILTRSGHHCAQPMHDALGWEGTVRASFYFYNTAEDVERLAEGLVVLLRSLSPDQTTS